MSNITENLKSNSPHLICYLEVPRNQLKVKKNIIQYFNDAASERMLGKNILFYMNTELMFSVSDCHKRTSKKALITSVDNISRKP